MDRLRELILFCGEFDCCINALHHTILSNGFFCCFCCYVCKVANLDRFSLYTHKCMDLFILIRIGRWEECQRNVQVKLIQNRRWIIMRTRRTLIIQRTEQRWIIVQIRLIQTTLRQRANNNHLPLETRGVCIFYIKIHRLLREYFLNLLTITLIYAIF